MKMALLISSDDPYSDIYRPEGKWGLFRERIAACGSALWGLNAGEPRKAEQCEWVYVHVKGTGTIQARMRLAGYEYYKQPRALPEDPRRIPRFKCEAFKLFLEITSLEILTAPINTLEETYKLDGTRLGNAPQSFTYIRDPL